MLYQKRIIISLLLSLLCFFKTNATAGEGLFFNVIDKTDYVSSSFGELGVKDKSASLKSAANETQFSAVARINQRYHEWIAAFLSGTSAFTDLRSPVLVTGSKTLFAAQLNSCCLSTSYDLLFLFCLF